MGKPPAFQWYPGDWFREPGLKVVDLRVRGAWAELLMIMFDTNPQGHMESSVDGFAKLWRIDISQTCYIIDEIDVNKIGNVKYFDDDVRKMVQEASLCFQAVPQMSPPVPDLSHWKTCFIAITNRRMYKEWENKEKERIKKQKQRAKKSAVPPPVPDRSTPLSSSSPSSSKKNPYIPFQEIVEYLNQKSGKDFKWQVKETQGKIRARWKDGFSLEDFKHVIDVKCNQWLNDPKMVKFIRPKTLFGTNFEGYKNESKPKPKSRLIS